MGYFFQLCDFINFKIHFIDFLFTKLNRGRYDFFMTDIYYVNTLYLCIFLLVSCLYFFSVTMSNEEEKEEEAVGADTGLSEPGVPGVPWHPQILAHQLTLSQPEESNYAHHITKGQ